MTTALSSWADLTGGRAASVNAYRKRYPVGIQLASFGDSLGFVLENRIACCDAQTGEVTFLTSDHGNPPSADAVVFSPEQARYCMDGGKEGFRQLWLTETVQD